MTAAAESSLLAPLLAVNIHVQLLLVLLGGLLVARLPPREREGLAGSVGLYGFGLVVLVASVALATISVAHAVTVVQHLAIVVMGFAGIRMAGIVLFRVLLPVVRFRPPHMVEDLTTLAGYVVWTMARLSHAGVDLGSIVTSSALITAGIAFSLQEYLGNIFGGASLQLENSIHVGDWIKVDDVIGRVVDIRWRSTVIETRNWETVVVPNSVLMKNKFTVLGRRGGEPLQWRRWIWFSCTFDTPPRRVIHTVDEALRRARIPNVAQEPAPNCQLMDLRNNKVEYALRYWLTDLAKDDPTDSAVRERVFAAFRRAGIEFNFDEHVVHLVQSGEAEDARRRRKDLDQRVSILRRIELFKALSDEERATVAEHLVYAPFLPGETLTRQGDVAHWLYLVVSGDVEVVLDENGEQHALYTIRGGADDAFFGEMGMLTGAPRSASVVALSEVECYRLDKEGFQETLRARPAIAEELSTIMAQRKANLAMAREELSADARQRLLDESRGELLGRIRRFFKMEG